MSSEQGSATVTRMADGHTGGGSPRCGETEIVLFPGRLAVPATVLGRLVQQSRHLAGDAYDDVRVNGDEPVSRHREWRVFHRFPVVTRGMNAVWRMMAARSFDDLADELRAGTAHPRTIGEHLALELVLADCRRSIDVASLNTLRGTLVDRRLIGELHDPASAVARDLGAHPDLWFHPMIAGLERDPRRGFRDWR